MESEECNGALAGLENRMLFTGPGSIPTLSAEYVSCAGVYVSLEKAYLGRV